MKYKCEKCEYKTDRKSNYLNHLSRKKPCNTKSVSLNTTSQSTNICKYCKKELSTNSNMNRHMKKNCPGKERYEFKEKLKSVENELKKERLERGKYKLEIEKLNERIIKNKYELEGKKFEYNLQRDKYKLEIKMLKKQIEIAVHNVDCLIRNPSR